jgi:hypothetical protein
MAGQRPSEEHKYAYLEIPLLKPMPWVICNIFILYILKTRRKWEQT